MQKRKELYEMLEWIRICLLRFPDCEKRNKQSLHWYGFSPLWIRKCLVSVELSEKAFLHIQHLYGLSPECVRMWVVTEELCEKRRSQTGQRKGFSPLCVRMWAVKLAACEKDLLHVPHLYNKKVNHKTKLASCKVPIWPLPWMSS